ncbi:glycoside hydrolase family 16 protein [Suillus subalutaceus]|uniref:glycoside hydrolase family 16 protein n=1 Tax=Suillus subalutaceus TaxID=48586 RepID=UPI001B85FEA9|nr:glycoside hydrolase family 16 protein [Suillus subalutaceus]KAG1860666.1 glycoside hydrolase family 16 protein [Suillus subalutaceus]
MHTLSKLFLAALSLTTLVGAHQSRAHSRHRRTAVRRQSTNKTYTIQDFYQGEDFFNNWDFFTGSDPTSGNVNYQSQSAAQSKGLAYVNDCDNSTVLAVDSTSTVAAGGNRDSVRITSQNSYNGGLFVIDASNMPVGCSTWPSFWTVGPNWPSAGEIDIVEGVNNQATNQMTLHSGTGQGCTIGKSNSSTDQFTGQVLGTNCYSTENADSGCGVEDTDTRSFGYGFNNAEGGVFALLWDNSSGMSMWHFAPPTPSTWGTPSGFWSADTCDITDNFYDHQMVIDTTICGNWAGGAYSSSGCPGTCSDMVANATNYVDAKWIINYVAVYQ